MKMKKDVVVMLKAIDELKSQKEMLQTERDYQESEVKWERNRNEIAYRTWQEAKVVLEEKLKKSQVDHQRIKDDLDNQLRKALHENLALQDSLRERDNRP